MRANRLGSEKIILVQLGHKIKKEQGSSLQYHPLISSHCCLYWSCLFDPICGSSKNGNASSLHLLFFDTLCSRNLVVYPTHKTIVSRWQRMGHFVGHRFHHSSHYLCHIFDVPPRLDRTCLNFPKLRKRISQTELDSILLCSSLLPLQSRIGLTRQLAVYFLLEYKRP